MSYIYGCRNCNVSLESPSPRQLMCSGCGSEMDLVATESWSFKCSSCGEILQGNPQAEPKTQPCPFCDDGIIYPMKI